MVSIRWTTLKDMVKGAVLSVPITLIAGLMGIPLGFSLLGGLNAFGLLGLFSTFMAVPVLANIFVWRAYMARSSTATQYSLLVTGAVLSFAFALLFMLALFLAFTDV